MTTHHPSPRADIGPRVPDDWFVGFHQGLAARFWRAAGATMADADTRVVTRLLDDLAAGADVLDVPCGDGRIALALAARGLTVTGIDISPEEIQHARRRAGDQAAFRTGDLRALPERIGPFDAIVSWGNSFGYLMPQDTAASLTGLHDVLRPAGRLLLETRTIAESFLPAGIRPEATHTFGGIEMHSRRRYVPEESRLEAEYVFRAADGAEERTVAAHHVHTTGELVRMLKAAGFGSIDLLDADGEQPYEVGAGGLIAVARA